MMSRTAKRSLVGVVALLAAAVAYAGLSPNGRYYCQLFALGVKHGTEDKQSGITYATGDAGWRIWRNSKDWTNSEKSVVYRLFAEAPASAKSDISIFMAGYACGDNVALCWTLAAVIVAETAGLTFRIVGRKRRLAQRGRQGV